MADKPLTGQRALVTGATSGIGRAVAWAFVEAGASVAINHLQDAEEAQRMVDEITDQGGEAMAIQGDVSRAEDCRRLFESAERELGGVDILMANAGIQRDAAFTDMTLDEWRRVLDVNLTGQFLCAQEAVRQFRRQGLDEQRSRALGKILFTSSVHQRIPWAGRVNYAAAKGGVKLLMESMALEMSAERIRVNAIAPGAIKTAINAEAWEDEAARRELLELIPYGRLGEPGDIAKAAVWLASDESDYVVGTTLFVDGGMTLYPGFRSDG